MLSNPKYPETTGLQLVLNFFHKAITSQVHIMSILSCYNGVTILLTYSTSLSQHFQYLKHAHSQLQWKEQVFVM